MGTTTFDASHTNVSTVDFRRPSRISRDAIVALESMHEAFARRLATSWSASSYTVLEVEHVSTEQLSVDDFVRSLPVPTALGTLEVDRIASTAFVQVDLPFALLFVERLLGGAGDPTTQPIGRRPTDLETSLLVAELYGPVLQAVDEALRDLDGDAATLTAFDTTPQPLQLGSPGELLLLLTYRAEFRGDLPGQGLVTLAYPIGALVAHLDPMVGGRGSTDAAADLVTASPIRETLLDAPVDVRVRLNANAMPAAVVAGLAPGDVLRLDHPADQPAQLLVDDQVVGSAHLGRRRRRIAVQVVEAPASRAAPAADGLSVTAATGLAG